MSLITRSAREHILLLVVHHIVIDFWSLAVLLNELGVLYPAECSGVKADLPPLALQYTDYVRWQAEMLGGPDGKRLWAYWGEKLAGQLPILEFPTDRPRPAFPTYQGASHDFTMDAELSRGLKALAMAHGATLYMVLLAAFQVALSHHTNQEDLVVGTPMVGRSRAEFEGIVGLFTNPVVLRTNLSGNPSFAKFLGRVRRTVLDALEHQDFPTVLLVERLRPSRDLEPPAAMPGDVRTRQAAWARRSGSIDVRRRRDRDTHESRRSRAGVLSTGTPGSQPRPGTADNRNARVVVCFDALQHRFVQSVDDGATVKRISKHFCEVSSSSPLPN